MTFSARFGGSLGGCYRSLAARFVENFKKFEEGCAPEVIAAGPKL